MKLLMTITVLTNLISSCQSFTTPSIAFITSNERTRTALQYANEPSMIQDPTALLTHSTSTKQQQKQQRKQQQKQEQTKKNVNLKEIKSMKDFQSIVLNENENKIVICRFTAPWCHACKSIEMTYRRLVKDYSSSSSEEEGFDVTFVDVPMNEELYDELGVESIPFAQIYHSQLGLLEGHKLGRRYISDFTTVLKSYANGSSYLQIPQEQQDCVLAKRASETTTMFHPSLQASGP